MSMFRRTEADGSESGGGADAADRRVRARTGGLDGLLSTAPVFPARMHGYDRLAVDNYVAWAESELSAVRREAEHLLARYGECAAELEISHRLLAEATPGREPSPVSDRVRDVFRLAAEEAAALVESAGGEADQLLAEARLEADARLRKAHEIKETAAATADEMRELAGRDRAEAAALLERARAESDELVRSAAAERDRLVGEAARAAEELMALQAELADLGRQRDDARSGLHRLTEQIQAALALATGASEKYLMLDNAVVDDTVQAPRVASVPS
jgi:cell division septum initiation protein DivIVA